MDRVNISSILAIIASSLELSLNIREGFNNKNIRDKLGLLAEVRGYGPEDILRTQPVIWFIFKGLNLLKMFPRSDIVTKSVCLSVCVSVCV